MSFIQKNPTLIKILVHLSVFINIFPFAGILTAYIIYNSVKNENKEIAQEAIKAINWQITMLIAAIIFAFSTLISFGLLGLILWPIYGCITIISPILGALKTANNEPYRYPFSLNIIT